MSRTRARQGALLVAGGVAILIASPAGADIRLGIRSRISALAHRHDPVEPFCAAPCYARGPAADVDTLTGRTEALP